MNTLIQLVLSHTVPNNKMYFIIYFFTPIIILTISDEYKVPDNLDTFKHETCWSEFLKKK